jgi:transcriptional regulator with XRE-family HTH domain
MTGKAVKFMREAKGWTQLELAHTSKLSLRTITSIENNAKYKPKPGTLRKLCEVFGLDFEENKEWLFDRTHKVVIVRFPSRKDLEGTSNGMIGSMVRRSCGQGPITAATIRATMQTVS